MPDAQEGCTLRAFLARKLACAPMRITKKFSGATLGKAVFHRHGALNEFAAAQLRQLEAVFHRSNRLLHGGLDGVGGLGGAAGGAR